MSKCCMDQEFLDRVLDQLFDLLDEAYYSTPPHISSKTLIKRAKDLVNGLRASLHSLCKE